MRIKALSIRGFKTFYEKSLVEFDSNISAIVGPNGCGKTNILDAFRWVLGEQNPRILRSDSMSQIISDGNDNLSKQGFAEVSLLIENEKNDLTNFFISGNLDLTNLNLRLYEISAAEKLNAQDTSYIEKEFNDFLLFDSYKSFFDFINFKKFIQTISSESE